MYKYYIYIISFIYIAFFIRELESSGLHRELIITMFVWKGSGFFFCHSLVSLCEVLSGLKCPLNSLNSAYFREISTYRNLEGANPVPEQYRSDPLEHVLYINYVSNSSDPYGLLNQSLIL